MGIRTFLQAVGIIAKEVRDMTDDKSRDGLCVECGKPVSHYGSYFCKDCAAEFFKEEELTND